MVCFKKEIDMNSREEMIDYLKEHFRYNTMNSWNNSTSYAHNLKIYNLGLSREQEDILYEMSDCDELWDDIDYLIDCFGRRHEYKYQAGFNGRSNGYLVLYQGETKPSEHKSFCTSCGQKNFTSTEETGRKCGRCGKNTRVDYEKPPMQILTYPGRSLDMDEDFEDWSLDDLQRRVTLIQSFDKLADDIVQHVAYVVENFEIDEEEYFVPKSRKILVEK